MKYFATVPVAIDTEEWYPCYVLRRAWAGDRYYECGWFTFRVLMLVQWVRDALTDWLDKRLRPPVAPTNPYTVA